MAPEIVWRKLPKDGRCLRVLDPMAGSGTTLVTARMYGHKAIGFDSDPLAVLIANAWIADLDVEEIEEKAKKVLKKAQARAKGIKISEAYPPNSSGETKEFIRYWFDATNRRQLTALAASISSIRDARLRGVLWCAFSRLIITKHSGASLAMDVSHSRPHKTYEKAPINAFDHFERAAKYITKASPFKNLKPKLHRASVKNGDARKLPLKNASVDMVITSPPYLNAIDYLRGHKLSLVWMGHEISDIRNLRSANVGAEVSALDNASDQKTEAVIKEMCGGGSLEGRKKGMVRRYVQDLRAVIRENFRVLRKTGRAVYVVGNCNLQETFIQNSKCISVLAEEAGFQLVSVRKRPLPENRRYLPPPAKGVGNALRKRMREEVILSFVKN